LNVTCGVPGISCWAFTIRYIYINDIVKASTFNTVLHADDISLHISGENHKMLEKKQLTTSSKK